MYLIHSASPVIRLASNRIDVEMMEIKSEPRLKKLR
jgi:hypothetical protein